MLDVVDGCEVLVALGCQTPDELELCFELLIVLSVAFDVFHYVFEGRLLKLEDVHTTEMLVLDDLRKLHAFK